MSGRTEPQAIGDALPTRRVILLGASNVARSFPVIISTVRRTWPEPIDFMVAMGHGRSYGVHSQVLGRKIPGIFPCALWRDLQNRAALPTTALITDIGNDLLFGTTPERLLKWVEGCVDRLAEAGASTVITQLPEENIARLGEYRFLFFRRVIFPRCKLSLAEARQLVQETNERLIAFGEARKVPVIPVSPAWYGLDPIHVARRRACEAWAALLGAWREGGEACVRGRRSLLSAAYLAALVPEEWSQFSFARRAQQPCGRFFDGTTISLY
jgi:hypothetical protein